jgi:hypothetical protein
MTAGDAPADVIGATTHRHLHPTDECLGGTLVQRGALPAVGELGRELVHHHVAACPERTTRRAESRRRHYRARVEPRLVALGDHDHLREDVLQDLLDRLRRRRMRELPDPDDVRAQLVRHPRDPLRTLREERRPQRGGERVGQRQGDLEGSPDRLDEHPVLGFFDDRLQMVQRRRLLQHSTGETLLDLGQLVAELDELAPDGPADVGRDLLGELVGIDSGGLQHGNELHPRVGEPPDLVLVLRREDPAEQQSENVRGRLRDHDAHTRASAVP